MKISLVYSKVGQMLQQLQLLSQAFVVERTSLPEQVIYADLGEPDLNR